MTMIAKFLLPAAAVMGAVTAQCSQSTATINAPADATGLSSCTTFQGSIVISSNTVGDVDLSGIQQITGGLSAQSNQFLTSISSSTLGSIAGEFKLVNLTGLLSLNFGGLSSVGSLTWKSLTAIDTLKLGGSGITSAKNIEISDTFLTSLQGINVPSVAKISINNNRRLSSFVSPLTNLSDILILQANGLGLAASFPLLTWAANMSIANVSKFDIPALVTVNGSARFDTNYFTQLAAPNLTSTQTGDISFIGNSQLTNVSFPNLNQIGGGLLIANNTALVTLDGFPKLKNVLGAVKLRGNFKDIEFPSLQNVKGAFDASSTTSINDSCAVFAKLAPKSQGGNEEIQGTYNCQSDNANANQDTNTTTTGGSGSGSKSAAAGIMASSAFVGLALVAGALALL